ncbi:MAG: response regulator [Betaproteobacteria bacterium]|nr:response regulator [Betaproteobacteria bacterium]
MSPIAALESRLKWLAAAIAMTVALLMPGFTLVSSYQNMAGALESEARVSAQAVTEFIHHNPGVWTFQRERIDTALVKVLWERHHEVRVHDEDGREIAGLGESAGPFSISRVETFHDFGKPAGRVTVRLPLRDILGDALVMLAVGIGIGLLVFFPMRNRPLRALRDATRALTESEQRNRTVVSALDEGVMLVDRGGHPLLVNEAARVILGDRADAWLTRRGCASFLADEDNAPVEDAEHPLTRALERGETLSHRLYRLAKDDGSLAWIRINTRPLADPRGGGIAAVVASLVDLSEDRAREEELARARDAAEAASRAKSWFLANMSHEIRTPMNGVLGMADLLAHDPALNEEQREHLAIIQQSGQDLLNILNDILDFSKIEAGHLHLADEVFDLRRRLASSLELHQARARAKGLAYSLRIDDDVPTWVRGDPGRLHQILANLIGNGIKFTARGSVRVAVGLAPPSSPDDGERLLRFEVRDTGIGIAPEFMPRLFTHFSQEDASTTRRYGGTGLGLAIARQLTHLMGGEIGADSAQGEGSRFWFTVLLPAAAPPAEAAPTGDEGDRPLRGRVLVVEDDPTNRLLAEAMLKSLGCFANVVDRGEAALDWLAGNACDLILMDIEMPGIGGIEATARIRTDEAATAGGGRARIIALTASAMPGDRERCIEAGMDDYLSKPFTRDALKGMLERWLPADSRSG